MYKMANNKNKMCGSGLLTFVLAIVLIVLLYKMMYPASEGYKGGAPLKKDDKNKRNLYKRVENRLEKQGVNEKRRTNILERLFPKRKSDYTHCQACSM